MKQPQRLIKWSETGRPEMASIYESDDGSWDCPDPHGYIAGTEFDVANIVDWEKGIIKTLSSGPIDFKSDPDFASVKGWFIGRDAIDDGAADRGRVWRLSPKSRVDGYMGIQLDSNAKTNIKTGHHCLKCKTFNDYAASNREDGTYVCYECR